MLAARPDNESAGVAATPTGRRPILVLTSLLIVAWAIVAFDFYQRHWPHERHLRHIPSGDRFEVPSTDDELLFVESLPGKPTVIVLPPNPAAGQNVEVNDNGGNASSSHITVLGNGNKINETCKVDVPSHYA